MAAAGLDATGQQRLAILKAWRAALARENSLPAYVILHDATLVTIAARAPGSLDELAAISGIGAAKLARYGPALLQAVQAATGPATRATLPTFTR